MARGRNDNVLVTSAALGAIAGLRSMAAPALLTHEMAEDGAGFRASNFERLLSSDAVSGVLAVLAGGEMIADKTSAIPNRTNAVPLIGRAVIGSLTAGAYASRRQHPVFLPAVVGAA